MDNYPFYNIETDELHEVGVGPIHAGVIEPGHFRFICNGEKVLHLEIHIGYQHRGVEELFLTRKSSLQHSVLSESIAGDTAIGHGLAFTQLMESFAGIRAMDTLQIHRCIALELERIAIHIGDTAALCADVAYQLGQVVCESLRTIVINTTQLWCGNRFGKGLIRVGGSHYPLNYELIDKTLDNMMQVESRFFEMTDRLYSLTSVLARFEGIGKITQAQAALIGAVGPAARITELARDIRSSHPFQYYQNYSYTPALLQTGDVMARALIRRNEIEKSLEVIRWCCEELKSKPEIIPPPEYSYKLTPQSFGISLTEGWRGEICHSVITGTQGEIVHYKVKDPSLHNWMALALAVRNQEISDFPICNKSFNLSYCGYDL
jgi:Ni,Fe-hydrogenase III large subunit